MGSAQKKKLTSAQMRVAQTPMKTATAMDWKQSPAPILSAQPADQCALVHRFLTAAGKLALRRETAMAMGFQTRSKA
jgi:hypothetical protein